MALSNKRKAFVNEYLREFNATRAAKAAGYSDKTAYSQGQRLLKNVEIYEAIKDQIEMSANEVRSRLSDIARGDIADLMEITPMGFTLELMTHDANGILITNPKTKLIKKIKQKVTTYLAKKDDDEDRETIETEIELYSAHEALRDIGRMHKLFVDRQEVTGVEGGPIEVKNVGLSDDERAARITTIFDAARERRTGQPPAASGA